MNLWILFVPHSQITTIVYILVHIFNLILSFASLLLKEFDSRYLGKSFVQFFLSSWIYLKFKSLIWTVKSDGWRFNTLRERIRFSWNIIEFMYLTISRVSAEIKSYIRKSICEKYRDKKHCISLSQKIENSEKAARVCSESRYSPYRRIHMHIVEHIVRVCMRASDLLISNLHYWNLSRSIWKLLSCFSFNLVNLLLMVTSLRELSRKLKK